MAARKSFERTDVDFRSGGARCAGWLYRPTSVSGDAPCVVMAHGFSLTRHDGLATYAEALAEAGAAVLAYDHRYLGDSAGEPHQRILISEHEEDRRSAIGYVRRLPGIDPDKIVVWGYSVSGITAVRVAVKDGRVAGAILLFPVLDGRARTFIGLRTDPKNTAWALVQAIKDVAGRTTLVPVTAQPGCHGLMTLPGEANGFRHVVGANSPWQNAVRAGPISTIALYRPVTKARKLRCPVLVQLGERDISAPSQAIEKLARHAPRAELKRYDLDHFQPFYGEHPARIASDQADWLTRVVRDGH